MTGKKPQAGFNVSHANNKTKRRFKPNLQMLSLMSEALGHTVRVRLSVNGLRTVERNGGLDAFLLAAADQDLDVPTRRLKRRIEKAAAKRAA
jgi:large subunit ribosomal protein L28